MLHIHNGESTAGTLKEFGFPGEHFAFREVLIAGPTPSGLSKDEWRRVRSKFLIAEYELEPDDCERSFRTQDGVLRRFTDHEEVILWFEHDLFCQINLIYLLDWFSRQSLGGTRLSLICIGEFPGIEDFRGLGQLTGEQLATLFDNRHEVSELELRIASSAWAAYTSPNPGEVTRLLDEDTSAMPFLGDSLRLHLTRFPSIRNGLGQIEQNALELISEGAVTFKSLFPKFANADPDYGLGDGQFWSELRRIKEAKKPLIILKEPGDPQSALEANRYYEASFEITDTGSKVLAGELDFVEVNGIDLWLGGVHLIGNETLWRWDSDREQLVRSNT
jgi:hypothetical protein